MINIIANFIGGIIAWIINALANIGMFAIEYPIWTTLIFAGVIIISVILIRKR